MIFHTFAITQTCILQYGTGLTITIIEFAILSDLTSTQLITQLKPVLQYIARYSPRGGIKIETA